MCLVILRERSVVLGAPAMEAIYFDGLSVVWVPALTYHQVMVSILSISDNIKR